MKIEKHVEKLMAAHGRDRLVNETIRHITLPQMLLSMSNYCMSRSNEGRMMGSKEGERMWRKRAKLLHDMMEDVELEA